MLRAQVIDELTICFHTVGRFPEVGDEIENIDFFHGLSFLLGLNGKNIWKVARERKAQGRKLKASA